LLDWIVGLGLGWLAGRFIGGKINSKTEQSVIQEAKQKGYYIRRAYEANSFYHDLGMNPYFMNYGDYGGYYGRGYDYLSNPSPK